MKYLFQFAIISAVAFIGEVMGALVPLPVPASVWGLIIMLTLLISKIVPVKAVEDTSMFLLSIMAVVFVPPTVALLEVVPSLGHAVPAIVVIAVASTVLVMAATGLSAQFMMRKK
ncbi:MAG: CidA/LrgA family protein [Rickettsiales bacterium]|jgi:holin-like protein|nr:CidA/LrgA family protein [Rickettsiales bacterium]